MFSSRIAILTFSIFLVDAVGREAFANGGCYRTVTAEVVALDQVYTYNRFGTFNPAGMIYALKRDVVAADSSRALVPGNARLREGKRPRPLVLRANQGDCLNVRLTNLLAPVRPNADSPATRLVSFHVNGLQYVDIGSDGAQVGQNGNSLIAPGQSRTYRFFADHEGTFLAHSMGATFGGEGDGGSTTQGLFAAVNVEPEGSIWLRSQVTEFQLKAAQRKDRHGNPLSNPDGTPILDFGALDGQGMPILRMTTDDHEIVHSDLTAIISGFRSTEEAGTTTSVNQNRFREFTVIFHDEIQAVQAFPELNERTFDGVRDATAINYGSAAAGAEILANRRKIGPTRNCVECKFEEFFLTSWAGGDPAMNVERDGAGNATGALFPDDPSNVYHSYIGDPVRFRNIHAGPKETHIFHLHAHQWLKSPNNDKSSYLDAQSISPGSAFTYDINFGGSGNRNLEVGDSIFHCHLYSHFAQGMWGLWRSHDVFEAGTPDRNLPDGEIAGGTPNPAIVPLPKWAMPPMPTYESTIVALDDGTQASRPALPGFPFFEAAIAGHRPSQPPLDMAHDGGLPRHLITSVPAGGAVFGTRGQFDVEIQKANIKLLPQAGTPPETAAMQYHAGSLPGAVRRTTVYGWPAAAYRAFTPEGRKTLFFVNGQPPKPGAPYAEPCPPGAPERTYQAAYVQIDMTVNSSGWHDPQARLTVLNQDVDATLSGRRPPEPFVIRARSGECVNFHASNLIPDFLNADDFQIFTPTDTIGQHIHLVKFDPTSSDGSGNGFNYEDGTFASGEVNARILAANALGGAFEADGTLTEGGAREILAPAPNPLLPSAPAGTQTTIQRWWADPILNRQGRDRTMQSAFTHDHFGPSSHQQHGLYAALVVEPGDSTWRDPETGAIFGSRPDGGPTSWRADILTEDPAIGPHREFTVAIADFALLYDAFGVPVNPPTFKEAALPKAVEHPVGVVAPEAVSAGDPGSMVLNYRNDPIPLRIATRNADGTFTQKSGDEGDMANVFRSDIHGDPFNRLLRGYDGDRMVIRLLEGAQEELHSFSIHGHKWLREPSDPDSGFINAQGLGISEHFEAFLSNGLNMRKNYKGTSDYLVQSTPTDDLWNGTWTLLRSYGKRQPDLLPLPGRFVPETAAAVPKPDDPCPPGARLRKYRVHAITAKGNLPGDRLVYNERFDLYDPDAVLFVREEHLADFRSGVRKPEPLILRAAAGECISVKLFNDLPEVMPKTAHWNYNPPITEGFNINQVRSSNQVSLHPQLVTYDIAEGDGANVGFNDVQTVKPGQNRTYRWYAGDRLLRGQLLSAFANEGGSTQHVGAIPTEFGVINLKDMGDVVNHGMHGAIGVLVVEPKGAAWTTARRTEAQADVFYRDPQGGHRSFREFVLAYQDELGLHTGDPRFQSAELNSGTAVRNHSAADDAEDTGQKGFNYRTEPLWARLGLPPQSTLQEFTDQQLGDLLSSNVHGDPATPVFSATAGASLRLRVAIPSSHGRSHAFSLSGSEWRTNPWSKGGNSRTMGANSGTAFVGTQGTVTSLTAWNVRPLYGAGGASHLSGDFLYRDQPSLQFDSGLWGIIRVRPEHPGKQE